MMKVVRRDKRIFSHNIRFRNRNQIMAVSHERYNDANVLYYNKRYNGSIYLGGFVIECLLKSSLWNMRTLPNVMRLFYTSHELDKLLYVNVNLYRAMVRERMILSAFMIISSWNVSFRYVTRKISVEEAEDFMGKLKEVRKWILSHI